MKRTHLLLAALLLQSLFLLRAQAQEAALTISLPDARAGESYKQSLPRTLHDRNGKSVNSGSQEAAPQWAAAAGKLPPGLRLSAAGVLSGAPTAHRTAPYTFTVTVTDAQEPDAEPLTLAVSVKILPPRLRLVDAEGGAAPPNEPTDAGGAEETPPGDDNPPQHGGPQKPQAVCGKNGITIETATVVRSQVIPINVKIDDSKKAAVKTLDITVRGTGDMRDALKPVPTAAASSVPLDIAFKTEGDNVISVNALDAANRLVACAETTVKYTAPPSTRPPPSRWAPTSASSNSPPSPSRS
jgi:hypothetical protein